MKTAFKLLLLSSSFLSANLFAESVWEKTDGQPGKDERVTLAMTMSPDGQIIMVAERFHAGTLFWRSTDGGKSWSVLTIKQ
jgi:hypothetical protein